jgi:beta-1,4-mannosyltransferase
MNVVFLPDYSDSNPYQWQLATALGRRGVAVRLESAWGRRPLRTLVDAHGYPDVLHLHWTNRFLDSPTGQKSGSKALQFLSDVMTVAARGTKVVWTLHNLYDHEGRGRRTEHRFNRLLASLCDRLLVHSEAARATIEQAYQLPRSVRHRIRVVPHAHFVGSYPGHVSRADARARFGIAEHQTVFLFFGQIRPYKGLRELLDAFVKLDCADAKLLIAGRAVDGATADEVQRSANSDPRILTALRFIPEDEVQLFMSAADIVVLPYRDILTSGSAILAMSFAKAVLMPSLPATREAIADDTDWLYDARQPSSLLEKMQWAMSANYGAVGTRHQSRVLQHGWEEMADSTNRIYEEVVRRSAHTARGVDPIRQSPANFWTAQVARTARELNDTAADGARVIVADEGQLKLELRPSVITMPFLERDGQFWGAPPDDDTAIRELERMRQAGAALLAFTWPAFWWLDFYAGFRVYLDQRFERILRNDRLVIYRL